MRAAFRVFESYEESWDELFRRAAEFASQLGPDRAIGISHSESIRSKRNVVVWFWEPATGAEPAAPRHAPPPAGG